MAEATCRKELDLEIPADEVTKADGKNGQGFCKDCARAGLPSGQSANYAHQTRFADDIKGEVLQTLVPEHVEKAVAEQKLTPVSQPQVDKLEYNEGQPVKFRAIV